MAQAATGDLKLGAKLRRLRRDRGWTQIEMADRLGVSASYLNLIEHNRRKVTASLLLQMVQVFNLPLAELAEDEESPLIANLLEALGDDLFEAYDLTNTDVKELVAASPNMARALVGLYDAYRRARADVESYAERFAEEDRLAIGASPVEIVSEFLQSRSNHFQDLEEEAERVRREIGIVATHSPDPFVAYLKAAHGVRVAFLSPAEAEGVPRRFVEAAGVLEIDERLPPTSRAFQVARQIAQLSAGSVIRMLVQESGLKQHSETVVALAEDALAKYFAAALLMPYDDMLKAAEGVRYDVELLMNRFGVSFEQACHRLTTLNRPGRSGVPFHMLRIDLAGNISKRFSLSGLHIPRTGNSCARWNVCTAFMTPDKITTQLTRMPDGNVFFCIARTVEKGGAGFGAVKRMYSIGLGCALKDAPKLVYADGIELADPKRAVAIADTGPGFGRWPATHLRELPTR